MQKTIDTIENNRNELIKNLSRSFEGKLESSTPGELVNKIYKPNNIGEIRQLKIFYLKILKYFKHFKLM